jgi:hypothetical protein
VTDYDEGDAARDIAEAMSEVFNALCQIVAADRFGQLSPSDMPSFRSSLRQLIELIPKFRGSIEPGLDLIAEAARELELVPESELASPSSPRIRDLATRFGNAMGCNVFPPE